MKVFIHKDNSCEISIKQPPSSQNGDNLLAGISSRHRTACSSTKAYFLLLLREKPFRILENTVLESLGEFVHFFQISSGEVVDRSCIIIALEVGLGNLGGLF